MEDDHAVIAERNVVVALDLGQIRQRGRHHQVDIGRADDVDGFRAFAQLQQTARGFFVGDEMDMRHLSHGVANQLIHRTRHFSALYVSD
jgi:hypothetical protein